MVSLTIAQDPTADRVLSEDPFALLIGMLLDQQFPMERAFAGPAKVARALRHPRPDAIVAEADPEAFADLCATPPAVHRYGRSMAAAHPGARRRRARRLRRRRLRPLARRGHRRRAGRPAARRCPASASRRRGSSPRCSASSSASDPTGWEEACGAYAETGSYRSVADVVDAESLQKVRDFKKAAKAAVERRGLSAMGAVRARRPRRGCRAVPAARTPRPGRAPGAARRERSRRAAPDDAAAPRWPGLTPGVTARRRERARRRVDLRHAAAHLDPAQRRGHQAREHSHVVVTVWPRARQCGRRRQP